MTAENKTQPRVGRTSKLLESVTVRESKHRLNKDGSFSTEYVDKQTTVFDAIVTALVAGSYIRDAAEAAGVSERACHSWIARGQEHSAEGDASVAPEHEIYVQFAQAVERARAGAVLMNLDLVRTAAQRGSWQAAAWWLERTRPKQFGRRQAVELSGEVTTPAGAPDLSKLSLDEARELQALLEKAKPSKVEA